MNSQLAITADRPGSVISPNVYGHFAEHLGRCVYEGLWVGPESRIPNVRGIRKDVVAALKKMGVPVLRWPGGCFADEYHWKDGIGPRAKRPKMINTHWGGVVENNHFGTHEFLDLCEQIGCEPYICANVGSGTVHEMQQWVEYMTFDGLSPMSELRRKNGRAQPWNLKYFGVGNESWGCGGNMTPEYYANEYRRYATYARNYGQNRLYRIACGPNVADYKWMETLMANVGQRMNGISLHYYTVPTGIWAKKGSATGFPESEWFSTLKKTLFMDTLIAKHSAIMDRHDPEKKVGLVVDEWGTWYDVEPGTNPGFLHQQNTLRDGLVAALNFNIFHSHAARVAMANIAQTINVLQAVILTDKEKMILTPTYHAFEMYQVFQGATVLPLKLQSPAYTCGKLRMPAVNATAARDEKGVTHIGLVNCDPHRPIDVFGTLKGVGAGKVEGRVLTAASTDAHNTFARPTAVKPEEFTGARIRSGALSVTLPPKSVVVLSIG